MCQSAARCSAHLRCRVQWQRPDAHDDDVEITQQSATYRLQLQLVFCIHVFHLSSATASVVVVFVVVLGLYLHN